MEHGRDHNHRWSHKDAGRSHQRMVDLDPDEQDVEGLADQDLYGRYGGTRSSRVLAGKLHKPGGKR